MRDGDGRCGPYVPLPKNLQAKTTMDYRKTVWTGFLSEALEMVTALSLVFMLISFLI